MRALLYISMELKDIISISGKTGLYKIIAQTPKSMVAESIDEHKTKLPIHSSHQVAMLSEITIYSATPEDITLKSVFENIKTKDGEILSVTQKDSPEKIKEYFKEVAPNYDTDRVYISDMKKVLKWYELLASNKVL